MNIFAERFILECIHWVTRLGIAQRWINRIQKRKLWYIYYWKLCYSKNKWTSNIQSNLDMSWHKRSQQMLYTTKFYLFMQLELSRCISRCSHPYFLLEGNGIIWHNLKKCKTKQNKIKASTTTKAHHMPPSESFHFLYSLIFQCLKLKE